MAVQWFIDKPHKATAVKMLLAEKKLFFLALFI